MTNRSRQGRLGLAIAATAGLFALSFAASAGATVALSGSSSSSNVAGAGDGSVSEGSSSQGASQSPAAVDSSSPEVSTISADTVAMRLKPGRSALATPTDIQVRSAKRKVCGTESRKLPDIDSKSGSLSWTHTLEVLAARNGHSAGPIDGRWDKRTTAGVSGLQRELGEKADGSFGQDDWAALQLEVCPQPEPPTSDSGSAWSGDSSSGGSSWSGGSSGGSESSGGGTLVLVD